MDKKEGIPCLRRFDHFFMMLGRPLVLGLKTYTVVRLS